MRKIVIILVALMAGASGMAQNLAIGERTPKIKVKNRMEGAVAQPAEFSYLGFVHSASVPCTESLAMLANVAEQTGAFNLIIFTKERASAQTATSLRRYAEGGRSEVHTSAEEAFTRFGVNYAPFGVIVDKKQRVLWFGDPQSLDPKRVLEILDNHNNICRSRK
ncbi:MAG: hypothetical protein IIV91_05535 [Alistipes sp.]|nr:hypothetical protein [Alistipes sp.]